ncbi:MAG: heparinase, partial [Armatimonadetes bacterium]|nr:heparinase [Armatimonadota bacterium]
KRGWFRGGTGYPQTNQWVLPTEGLVRACLVLGKDQYPTEYEMGVANLLRALDVQGQAGEFNEGIGYAMFTVGSMVAAAHAMAVQGDTRALDHPFLRAFPTWAVEHLQPGRYRINCFDAGGAKTGRNDGGTRGLLATLAVFANSPVANWALNAQYDGPTGDLIGLLARTVPPSTETPPLFAFFDGPARRVNWRSGWADDATGVWVRGGHPLDSHDHFDRGHVNYIARGKPLLIEAGTPGYDNPSIGTLYDSVVGHNVLDIEGLEPRRAPAPISLARLDDDGGDLTVDVTACYPGLQQWQRQVSWDQSQLVVTDQVATSPEKPAIMTIRWHLGSDQPATITGKAGDWRVVWPDGRLTLSSPASLQITQERLPDNTVCLGKKDNGWDFLHTCIVVRTARAQPSWDLTTTVAATP